MCGYTVKISHEDLCDIIKKQVSDIIDYQYSRCDNNSIKENITTIWIKFFLRNKYMFENQYVNEVIDNYTSDCNAYTRKEDIEDTDSEEIIFECEQGVITEQY